MSATTGELRTSLPTSWLSLWHDLAERQRQTHLRDEPSDTDPWRKRVREFDASVRRRLSAPDSLRDLLVSRVDKTMTVLDVGAGTGGWAIPLARAAREVTCVEPSPAMLERLAANIRESDLTNVDVVSGSWPTSVASHDVVLCSHAMYAAPDFEAFVRALVASARREVYLVMRLPTSDGVMAEASQMVWGQPHDSPNSIVGYNALIEMGIYPDVLVQRDLWRPWTSESIDAGLIDIKKRLGISDRSEFDGPLGDLLTRRLEQVDGQYVWPAGVRSSMLWWSVTG